MPDFDELYPGAKRFDVIRDPTVGGVSFDPGFKSRCASCDAVTSWTLEVSSAVCSTECAASRLDLWGDVPDEDAILGASRGRCFDERRDYATARFAHLLREAAMAGLPHLSREEWFLIYEATLESRWPADGSARYALLANEKIPGGIKRILMDFGPLEIECVALALRWARDNRRRLDFERDEWWTMDHRVAVEDEKRREWLEGA